LDHKIFSIATQNTDWQVVKSLNPNLLEFDLLKAQLQELFCIRGLKQSDGVNEANRFLSSNPGYGNWVYYPWNNHAVKILEKSEFIELRTSRNRNKITIEEQKVLAQKTIGIVGMSVGFSVFLAMVTERIAENFKIADFDTLSMSNLNRLPFKLSDIGMRKVEIAKRWAVEIDPYIRIETFPEGVNENNLDAFFYGENPLNLVVDECDSGLIKLRLRLYARKSRIPLLMETSDRGLLDVENYQNESEPIFHNRISELEVDELLRRNSNEVLMRFIDISMASKRGRDSMLEIGKTLDTWPQLASDVMHGGAAVTIAARNILIGNKIPSGRYFMDLQHKLGVHEL